MAAKFWLPNGSIWLAPMITWRRPDHTMSNIERYGLWYSIVRASFGAKNARSSATRNASPSVIIRSGSNVARARRPPIIGMVPMGLATISPSPRKQSAIAATHTSANRMLTDLGLVAGLVDVDPRRAEVRPCLGRCRGLCVLPLEGLVAL